MARAFIALGSNLGDRRATLRGAIEALGRLGTVDGVSGLYQTAPVGGPAQDDFLNAVAALQTTLDPHSLLASLHDIEAEFNRVREVRWGPRTLDLDLILMGDEVVDTDRLQLPHPRYRERRFVLEPLLEIAPDVRDPDGTALIDEIGSVSDQELRRVADSDWVEAPSQGTGWVVAQLVLLAVFLWALGRGATVLDAVVFDAVGSFVLGAGFMIVGLAFRDLGAQTTPFPEPVSNGRLVRGGVYRCMRHPMYGGGLWMGLGATVISGRLGAIVVYVVGVVFFGAKARHEERRLEVVYPGYAEYRRLVPTRFIMKVGPPS